MSKALSVDLREQVVAAVSAGTSRRAAASRFGVSVSSVIRWCTLTRVAGSVAPGLLGGDRRSAHIKAHGALIRSFLDQKSDITLTEIRVELARAGVQAGTVTVWRFFQALRLTRKRSRRTQPSSAVRIS